VEGAELRMLGPGNGAVEIVRRPLAHAVTLAGVDQSHLADRAGFNQLRRGEKARVVAALHHAGEMHSRIPPARLAKQFETFQIQRCRFFRQYVHAAVDRVDAHFRVHFERPDDRHHVGP